MKNRKEYGIKFRRDESSGIAAVVVYDKTDGQYLTEYGIKQNTYVETLIDLYCPISGYTSAEKDCIYWITLEEGHLYDIFAKRSGTKNAASGDYFLNIVSFLSVEKMVDTQISGTLTTYHSAYETDKYIYDLGLYTYPLIDSSIAQNSSSLSKDQSFSVSTATSIFSLAGSNRAAKFVSISRDNGVTWLLPYSVELVWGSNAPYYNDETIDLDGYFSVNFSDPVDSGETVIVRYIPDVDNLWLEHSFGQPSSSDGSYIDLRVNDRFLDYALEIIPLE